MLFLVATNVVASQQPERRLTGTQHAARAKITIHLRCRILPEVYLCHQM